MPLSRSEAALDHISETAIVDFQVKSVNHINREAFYRLFHVHVNGKCVKNRLGELCN